MCRAQRQLRSCLVFFSLIFLSFVCVSYNVFVCFLSMKKNQQYIHTYIKRKNTYINEGELKEEDAGIPVVAGRWNIPELK